MAVVIGRASIKVYPDTKGFRRATIRELKDELRGIERDMAQDKDGGLKVRTSIDLDERESARNIQRFLNKIKGSTIRVDLDIDPKFEGLAEQIDDWRNRPVKIAVDASDERRVWREREKSMDEFERETRKLLLDTDSVSQKVASVAEAATRGAEDVSNSVIAVERDIEKIFREQLDHLSEVADKRREIEEQGEWANFIDVEGARKNMETVRNTWTVFLRDMSRKGKEVALNFNMSKFHRELEMAEDRLESLVREFDDTSLDFHPVLDETSLRTTWARIKWLTRDRFATIHVRVSESSARAARRAMEAIYSASGLRNSVTALKDLAEWMERLDRNAPALALVASGIAGVTGAVVGLTGSLAHVINEFGRMAGAALALPGILGGFAFGIGTMVAALQDFNREVPKIRDDLGMLQDRISDRFWDKARVPLLDAWNTVLPSLQRGLDRTATSLGTWTARMSEALAGAFDEGTMDKMFGNLAKSIEIASLSAGDFANILAVLGRTGSEYLPRLAQWGNDVAKSFSDWLTEAEKTGRLNEIMDTGIQKLKEFGALVREAGEFVYLLGSAAERAGFSGLGEMADGLERVNEQMKTLEGQRSLDDYFEGAARMAEGAKSAIGSVVSGLGDFSSTFRHISGDIQAILTDLGNAFEDILGNSRFQSGVKDLFGGLAEGIESITAQSGPIGDILGEIASLAGSVAENIGRVGAVFLEAFGPQIAAVVDKLAAKITPLGDAIASLIEVLDETGVGDWLIDFIGDLAGLAIDTITMSIHALAIAIEALNAALGDDADKDALMDRMTKFYEDLAASDSAFSFIGDWSLAIRDWTIDLVNALIEFGNMFVAGVDQARAMVAGAWAAFTGWLSSLFSPGAGGSEAGTFDLAGILPDFDGFITTFQEKIAYAQTWISDLWASFRAWLSGLFSGGGGGGGATGSVFNIDLVLNAVDNASAVIQSAAVAAVSFATGVYQAGLTAINRTGAVIANARAALIAWATARYQAALTALNRVSAGVSAARAQITAWARAKYQAVLTAVNRTAAGISSAVGAIVSRVVRGRFMATVRMNPVVQGLSSVVSRIRNAVSSFTANVRTSFSADGNILDGRGVQTFADGGIASGLDNRIRYLAENHVAQISGPTLRVWAEPETGGEAYIPLADSKRERSTAILGEVARRFGYRLEKYADGSAGGSVTAADDNINLTLNYIPGDQARTVTSDVMWGLKHRKRGGRARVAR